MLSINKRYKFDLESWTAFLSFIISTSYDGKTYGDFFSNKNVSLNLCSTPIIKKNMIFKKWKPRLQQIVIK
jgi:hypothetical protein